MSLDAAFAALADPTRRAILAELALGERTVNELVAPFSLTQPAISRHLRVLEEAGLIVSRVDGTRRPRRLSPRALDNIDAWLELLRRSLETNYERLDALLEEMSASEPASAPPSAAQPTTTAPATTAPTTTAPATTAPTTAAQTCPEPEPTRPRRRPAPRKQPARSRNRRKT